MESPADCFRGANSSSAIRIKLRLILHFPGTGIQDNLADKAKKLGTPVWKFE
jgi:hypothetical protein